MARLSQMTRSVGQQHRHLARRRMAQDLRLGVRVAQVDVDLVERNAGMPHGEPGPQAPARGVLVADHQPISHSIHPAAPFHSGGGAAIVIRRALPIMVASRATRAPLSRTRPCRQEKRRPRPPIGAVLVPADTKKKSVPVWLARDARLGARGAAQRLQKAWVEAQGFKGTGTKHVLLPGADGELAGVVLGLGEARARPHGQAELALGRSRLLPPGLYHLAERDRRCRAGRRRLGPRRLPLPPLQVRQQRRRRGRAAEGARRRRLRARAGDRRGVWLGRDLINTPASDLGPQELEDAARSSPSGTAPTSRASSATICWPGTSP